MSPAQWVGQADGVVAAVLRELRVNRPGEYARICSDLEAGARLRLVVDVTGAGLPRLRVRVLHPDELNRWVFEPVAPHLRLVSGDSAAVAALPD